MRKYKKWWRNQNILNINTVTIAVLLLILFINEIIDLNSILQSVGLSENSILYLVLVCIVVIYVNIANSLSELESKISIFDNNEIIKIDNLGQAIYLALGTKTKNISCLRVFALSSTMIQPAIRTALSASNSTINKCLLLTCKPYKPEYESEANVIFERWKSDPHVKSVHKVEYPTILSDFCILIDDDIAILGFYTFTDSDASGVSVHNVSIISSDRKTGQILISNCIDRFDESYSYFKSHYGEE